MEKNVNEEKSQIWLKEKMEENRRKIEKINEEINREFGLEDYDDFDIKNKDDSKMKNRDDSKIKNKDDSKMKNKKKRKKVFRKFEPIAIGIILSVVALVSSNIMSYNKGKQRGTKEAIENMKENYLRTCNLSSAPDKIIIAWVNDAYGQYSNDMIDCGILDANEKIESFRESYFSPLMRAYDDYIETNDIDRYNEFKEYVNDFEEDLSTSPTGKDYSFGNSVFSYAVLVDEENNIVDKDDGNTRIFIAEDFYYGTSDTITIKEGSFMNDGIIYSPYDSNKNKKSYSK